MKTANDTILDIMRSRFACKSFDSSRKISKDNFMTILEAGRLSPTSFGLEAYHMVVIENDDLKKKMAPLCWGAAQKTEASHWVVYLARTQPDLRYDSEYIRHILKDVHQFPDAAYDTVTGFFKKFSEEDMGFMNSAEETLAWSRHQTYIVMANMLTAAAALGIDSCPIEGINYKEMSDFLVKEGLMDPKHYALSVMAVFGYRAAEPKHAKSRQPLSDLVTIIR